MTPSAAGPEKNPEIVGAVFDVKESSKGYTFKIQDSSGKVMKCFYQKEIAKGTYCIKGRYSEDKTIFFVSAAHLLAQ